jgi:threonylcarbamoyladenosine tRNA methylthiotransferase MtaB
MKKIAPTFSTAVFGCRVNQAEQAKLVRALSANGAALTNGHQASFHLVHTCAVTAKAERQVRQHIYQIQKKFPATRVIATGCAATLWQKNGKKPGNIFLVANGQTDQVLNIISPKSPDGNSLDKKPWPQNDFSRSGRTYIKIQDGCNHCCAYCIVPTLRGRAQSRTIAQTVSEIKNLKNHVSEVILTAINTEYFGQANGETITQLIDEIFAVTNIARVSFGSIHPLSLSPQFIDWYRQVKNEDRLVHFFHIPVQSLSDSVLSKMRRGYKSKDILARLKIIKDLNYRAFIGTDVIAGFPGESENDFETTRQNLETGPIDRFHVFRFSPRPGTTAFEVDNQVAPLDAARRAKILRMLSEKKFRAFRSSLTGWACQALVLHTPQVLLANQVPADFPPTDKHPPGSIVRVTVTKKPDGHLTATVI